MRRRGVLSVLASIAFAVPIIYAVGPSQASGGLERAPRIGTSLVAHRGVAAPDLHADVRPDGDLAAAFQGPGVIGAPLTVAYKAGGITVRGGPHIRGRMEDTGGIGIEPQVAATNNGDIFVNGVRWDESVVDPFGLGLHFEDTLLRSSDEGRKWATVTPPGVQGIAEYDPYLYADPLTSRVFTLHSYALCAGGNPNLILSFSDDRGATWTSVDHCPSWFASDHPTMVAAPTSFATDGYPDAVYVCSNALTSLDPVVLQTMCAVSLDGGKTIAYEGAPAFGPTPEEVCPEPVQNPPSPFDRAAVGHIAADASGTLYVPKADCLGGPMVAISTDGAQSWRQVRVADGLESYGLLNHEAHIAVDSAGNLYYFWIAGEYDVPYLAISRDGGTTWSDPINVAPPGLKAAWGPSNVAGDEGKVGLYFYGTTSDCCDGTAQDQGATWNAYAVIIPNALQPDPTMVATTLNKPRHPVIRGACPTPELGPKCGPVADFLEAAIDSSGRMLTSIIDGCQGACERPQNFEPNCSDRFDPLNPNYRDLYCGENYLGVVDGFRLTGTTPNE